MRPAMHHLSVSAVRADALFVSALQRSEEPTAGQVRQAVAATVRAFGGRGCAERVAQEFGDHPETAAARMRWAAAVTGEAFGAGQPAGKPWLRQRSRPGGDRGQAPPARRRPAKSRIGARQAEYV
jgi:hypothetical protein